MVSLEVAKDLANALVRLIQAGMNPDITLVGHSLGATLLGLTGRYTQQQNVTIPWLYALDAARLLCSLYPQVDKTSGRTVVFVRTDPGGMGTNESTAHVDHRPNNGEYVTSSGSRLQPGCNRSYSPQEVASAGNRCSHDSAWRYFCEALVDRSRLILGLALSWFDFVAKNGTFTTTNYLWPVDPSKQGLFYCTTWASAPYGKGEQGLYP
ncbi:hypothetical protein ABMA27_001806 [Loxostege sticticalis]|uniref:Lipase domain-containing protein n=1 Tax=Loxostege sticticalis TaxID=481309 RepID=A0ABR3HVK3_LOXSC